MSDQEQPGEVPAPRPATPEQAARARARVMPNRLVVVEMVYFQSGTEDPVACEARYERRLSSDDMPYAPPRITLTESGILLTEPARAGWLTNSPIGMIHLKNEGPGTLMLYTNDCPEVPIFRVRPGESFRGEPVNLAGIVLRCSLGHCKIKYTLFPA